MVQLLWEVVGGAGAGTVATIVSIVAICHSIHGLISPNKMAEEPSSLYDFIDILFQLCNEGGILVRCGQELTSDKHPERLSTGALVEAGAGAVPSQRCRRRSLPARSCAS